MSKVKRRCDTETFHFTNVNPLNESTGDCVVRAISVFLGMNWEDTYRALAEYGMLYGRMLNCRENYVPYLAELGFEKQRMPRKPNRGKYTVAEFCEQIAERGKCYIVSMANHLTFVGPDKRIWDTWDCSYKTVGNYWVR